MKNWTKFQQQKKRRVIKMLDELSKRIQSGELFVESHGFWPSNLDNRITFRIIVIPQDEEKELQEFERFS